MIGSQKFSIAFYLLVAVFFFFYYFGADGEIVMRPANTVAQVGISATLKCSSSIRYPNWLRSASVEDIAAGAFDILAPECVYIAKWPDFTVRKGDSDDKETRNRCDLVIKKAMTNHSGVYTCNDPDRGGSSAVVTVIGQRMIFKEDREGVCLNCTDYLHNMTQKAKENRTSSMRCELRYNATNLTPKTPRLMPNLTWKDSWGRRRENETYSTNRRVVSLVTFPVDREWALVYTCSATFKLTWMNESNAQFSNEISLQVAGLAPGTELMALTKTVVFCSMAFQVLLKIFQW